MSRNRIIIIQINSWSKIYRNKILYFIFSLRYFIRYYLNNNCSKEIILTYSIFYLIYFGILLQINIVLVLFKMIKLNKIRLIILQINFLEIIIQEQKSYIF